MIAVLEWPELWSSTYVTNHSVVAAAFRISPSTQCNSWNNLSDQPQLIQASIPASYCSSPDSNLFFFWKRTWTWIFPDLLVPVCVKWIKHVCYMRWSNRHLSIEPSERHSLGLHVGPTASCLILRWPVGPTVAPCKGGLIVSGTMVCNAVATTMRYNTIQSRLLMCVIDKRVIRQDRTSPLSGCHSAAEITSPFIIFPLFNVSCLSYNFVRQAAIFFHLYLLFYCRFGLLFYRDWEY